MFFCIILIWFIKSFRIQIFTKLYTSRALYALFNAFLGVCSLLKENGIMLFIRSLDLDIWSVSGNDWAHVTFFWVILDFSLIFDIYNFCVYIYFLLLSSSLIFDFSELLNFEIEKKIWPSTVNYEKIANNLSNKYPEENNLLYVQ